MNITEAAQAFLHDHLLAIAKSNNAEALQLLLTGAGLPALARDDEPAEQIFDALQSTNDYGTFALRIARLLAKLLHQKADSLECRLAAMEGAAMAGSSAQVFSSSYLEDEIYVYNLFLLASRLPRDEQLFGGLKRFYDMGFTLNVLATTTGNRVGYQLRRALTEQQTDLSLRDYFLDLLQDKKRPWNSARRTELLEAWRGLLGALDLDQNLSDALLTIDTGLRTFHDTVEPHPENIDLLELALWRMDSSFPLDSPTWVSYLTSYWAQWPELLRDIAAKTWPGLKPEPLTELPPLPDDLKQLWDALADTDQAALLDIIKRNAAEEGRNLIKQFIFRPPIIKGLSPQEVRNLLKQLGDHFWTKDVKAKVQFDLADECEQWKDTDTERSYRKVSFDRLSRMEAVNRTLTEIDRRLADRDEASARRFLDELISQQRQADLPDNYLHTAKTLSKAASIVMRYGLLEWAETLLQDACNENPDDEVSANGLADVLKARGELEAAERQYRQNTVRWPNSYVAVNGLANVLRKLKRHTEALNLLPNQSADCYDLHLRAMILVDLGRIEDARSSLDEGLNLAISPSQKYYFQRGLALLEIRAHKYDCASKILAGLPDNVIPLDLFRLHAEVAKGQTAKANTLLRSLEARRTQMNINESKVFELVQKSFGLNTNNHSRQPNEIELEEIFDAEIELQLAA
ncbi:MAG: hypothetical protein ACXWT1_20395 [Methylobacter sp.]